MFVALSCRCAPTQKAEWSGGAATGRLKKEADTPNSPIRLRCKEGEKCDKPGLISKIERNPWYEYGCSFHIKESSD
jgi:hypothetical protein